MDSSLQHLNIDLYREAEECDPPLFFIKGNHHPVYQSRSTVTNLHAMLLQLRTSVSAVMVLSIIPLSMLLEFCLRWRLKVLAGQSQCSLTVYYTTWLFSILHHHPDPTEPQVLISWQLSSSYCDDSAVTCGFLISSAGLGKHSVCYG